MRKFTKKAVSAALAAALTVTSVMGQNVISINAETTTVAAAAETVAKTMNIHFTAPSTWEASSEYDIYAYAYYVEADKTLQEPLGCWPGTKLTKDTAGYYSTSLKSSIGSANVIFSQEKNVATTVTTPNPNAEKPGNNYYAATSGAHIPAEGSKPDSIEISASENYISETGEVTAKSDPVVTATPVITTAPTKAATTAPAKTATATAIATQPVQTVSSAATVAPVKGPHITVDKASGTEFFEEDSDALKVKLALAGGATSASVSLDNGPATVYTKDSTILVGQGKIANSTIKMDVTTTDGKTSNTQTFTYVKKTKLASTATVSSSMTKLFSVVRTLANATPNSKEQEYNLTFKKPSVGNPNRALWIGENIRVYAYAYYTLEGSPELIQEPLGIYPGTEMTTLDFETYGTKFTAATPSLYVKFVAVDIAKSTFEIKKNTWGMEYKDCEEVAWYPFMGNMYTVDQPNTDFIADGIDGTSKPLVTTSPVVTTAAPTDVPTATPVITTTPTTTPTSVPTATPTNKLSAYFGASLSAPQYNTTKQKVTVKTVNAKGAVSYSFSVDEKEVASNTTGVFDWDPSSLAAGIHKISILAVDAEKNSVYLSKDYTIVAAAVTTPIVATTPAVTATVVPTATPAVATTPAVTATTVPTATPVVTLPPVELPDPGVVTPKAIGGKITAKTGKTAGETISVKYSVTSVTGAAVKPYAYTIKITKSGVKTKTKTVKTSKKSFTYSWTPSKAGKYKISVTMKDKNGVKLATKTKNYTVKKRVITIKTFKLSKTSIKKGSKLKITMKATATKGTPKYKIVIKKYTTKNGKTTSKTVYTRKYSKKTTATYKTTAKGSYKVFLYVNNGKKVTVSKSKAFKVKK